MVGFIFFLTVSTPSLYSDNKKTNELPQSQKIYHSPSLNPDKIYIPEQKQLFLGFWRFCEELPPSLRYKRESLLIRSFRELPNIRKTTYKHQLIIWLNLLLKKLTVFNNNLNSLDINSSTKKVLRKFVLNTAMILIGGLTGVVGGGDLANIVLMLNFVMKHPQKIGKAIEKDKLKDLGVIFGTVEQLYKQQFKSSVKSKG